MSEGGRSSLDDVAAVLWPPPAVTSMVRGRAAQPDERDFLVLPFAGRPRLLVPSARRASAAAVRRYGEPGSFKAWAASRMLALALTGGAGAVGLGGRLRGGGSPGIDTTEADRGALTGGAGAVGLGGRLRVRVSPGIDTIEAYLSSVLGREVLISTHLGAARANRKPVLQLLTARGEPAGFAKISVNPLTRDLIRSERAALDALATENLAGLTVPRVLHYGQWQGRDVLVMTALPVWRRRKSLRPGQLAAAMDELAAVGGRSRGPLVGSGYLDRLRSRLEKAPAGPDGAVLGTAIDALAPAAGRTPISFGAWHGDWTGWNMACTAEGLLVWDWERFTRSVPIGFDALHYRLQSAVVRRRQPPAAAAAECVPTAPSVLTPFGVPAAEARLVAILYLTELSARYLADTSS